MTKQKMLHAMQKETDFKRLGILLELYALEALENNELGIYDPAMVQLRDMLHKHILNDYYLDKNAEGDYWYIRSGSRALLTYVYCSLMEWFPVPDIGNVLRIGEKMHYWYLKAERNQGDLDEHKVRNIMTVLDEKFSYSTAVFGEIIPVFLIMDVVPCVKVKHSFRTGCDQTYKGFVIWRYHDPVLPISRETAFLLNLSDTLFLKAWTLNKNEVCNKISPKLAELGFGWVLAETEEHMLRHMGDLICIGLASDTPLFKYMPFSDQSDKYRRACMNLTEDLVKIAASGYLRHTIAFN